MAKVQVSSPPGNGRLSRLPEAVTPYLQLMRLDRPNGYWYFWYPHAFGTLWAAIQQQSPVADLVHVNLVLLWGNLVMRGATCTWNDTADIEFDRKVTRCRGRPLARGARLLGALCVIRVDDWPTTAFYAANVVWTLLYELVYSHQDAAEDMAAGVKNLVLLYARPQAATAAERFGTMPLLRRLAVAQVLLLAASGALAGFGLGGYGAVAVAGTAAALATMLGRVRLEDPESCAWWFRVGNIRYTGGAMTIGLMVEYVGRVPL
ncbi:4-hydroxybenzoate octaprenyltransferase [Apiospora sp. TS-2023a]